MCSAFVYGCLCGRRCNHQSMHFAEMDWMYTTPVDGSIFLSDGLWSLQRPWDGSEQWCSLRLRSWGCSNNITWEPVRHANSLAPPQTKSETLDVRSGNFGSNRPSRWFWCSLNFKKHACKEHRLWTSLLSLNLRSIPSEPMTMTKLFNLVTPLIPHL